MGDLIDLAGATVIHQEQKLDTIQAEIARALAGVTASNSRREIKSLIIIALGHDGGATTYFEINHAFAYVIGALEIAKHDIIPHREWEDYDPLETPDA